MAYYLDDSMDFSAYLRETDASAKVKRASMWVDELIHDLHNPDTTRKIYLPWTKTTSLFTFRDGEVTMWAGQNGHGKSMMTSQVALSLMGQGERVCICNKVFYPVHRLISPAIAKSAATKPIPIIRFFVSSLMTGFPPAPAEYFLFGVMSV